MELYFGCSLFSYKGDEDEDEVKISETGWPSKGDEDEARATTQNAGIYNRNLMQRMEQGQGTPARPSQPTDIYIFTLFNENEKNGPTSERNFGLYYPDGTLVYNLGVKSYVLPIHPFNSLSNHAFDTMFQNTRNVDYYVHGSHHAQPMLPANQDPKNSVAFNNGSFQACAPFVEVENTINLAKWNCKPAGSSRSSAIYYPSSYS